jgi:hypothetical protein
MDKDRLKLTAAISALSRFGVVVERLPGEYRINYRNGAQETAQFAESLAEAVERGGAMAAERPLQPTPAPRARPVSRKAIIRRHNRQWAARRRKQGERAKEAAQAELLASLSFADFVDNKTK